MAAEAQRAEQEVLLNAKKDKAGRAKLSFGFKK